MQPFAQKTMTPAAVNNGGAEISPAELSQRVALLKRFKELLKAQRDRFHAYLTTLDRQHAIISGGTADDLLRHVELEEKIVEDIFSIQKVIKPLDEMYQAIKKEDKLEEEVINLKESLNGLKNEAIQRSGINRELLAKRMSELRSEIKILKNNPYNKNPGFSSAIQPSQIDIKG